MIIGIDEVGRGSWAGPVVAAAVAIDDLFDPTSIHPAKIADSKKLTPSQRRESALAIQSVASGYGLGWVGADEVDELGLSKAVELAMIRAYEELCGLLDASGASLIIDGNINYLEHISGSQALVRADSSIPAVSAASIVAKVARDDYMAKQSRDFPMYGFERHVGYGTKQHIEALMQHGACTLHRMSYKPVAALSL